jgi:hypothetical protein
MSNRVTQRPMSEQEREILTQHLNSAPTTATRWLRGSQNALVLWAVLMFLFAFVWTLFAWVVRATLRAEIGWSSEAGIWIGGLGASACAVYAVASSVRWVQEWRDVREDYHADLKRAEVVEEFYEFTAAKRFQEPEHGGLIYFLRTPDEKVFVLFDCESQDLGARVEDPLTSKFQPRTELLIVRAPKTRIVLSQRFSGIPLDAGDPKELSLPPQSWPESETYCKFRWDELESRLTRKTRKRSQKQ